MRVSAAEEAKQDAGDCGASEQKSEKENLRTMPQSVGGKEPATPTCLDATVVRPHPGALAELASLRRQLEEAAIEAATVLQETNKARQETTRAHAKALENQEKRHKEEMERERKASKNTLKQELEVVALMSRQEKDKERKVRLEKQNARTKAFETLEKRHKENIERERTESKTTLQQELEAAALVLRQEKDKESKVRLQLEEWLREAQMQAEVAKSQAAESMAEALQQRKARHIAEAKAAQKPNKPDEELVRALGQALATIEDLRRSVEDLRREASTERQKVKEEKADKRAVDAEELERLRQTEAQPWSQRLASLQVSDLAGGELERVQEISAKLQRQCTREQIRREMESEREASRQCVICLEREANLAFECGHQVCDMCGEGLGKCHICRKDIRRRIKLFRN